MASRARAPQKRETEAVNLPIEARIRLRAHQIYMERGGADGSELDDWLQAEQEIVASEPEKKAV